MKDIVDKKAYFEQHVKLVKPEIASYPDEGYVVSPKYTSINQLQGDLKRDQRAKANLTQVMQDPKVAVGQPSLAYIKSPLAKTTKEMIEHRKTQNATDLRALEPNMGVMQNAEQRLNEREMCYLRMA